MSLRESGAKTSTSGPVAEVCWKDRPCALKGPGVTVPSDLPPVLGPSNHLKLFEQRSARGIIEDLRELATEPKFLKQSQEHGRFWPVGRRINSLLSGNGAKLG